MPKHCEDWLARFDLDQETCRLGVLVHAVATVGEIGMLTFEDCLGLCELTAEEIAAIARHEHLPEIVALELGAHLARSAQGRRTIRNMIEQDIAVARERGDNMEVVRLDLVLRGFGGECAAKGTLEERVQALGFDPVAASWVRRRVQAYLDAMSRTFGLEIADLRERFPLEFLAAETRCAACGETTRCRRFLAGGGDEPRQFCPNSELFGELAEAIAEDTEAAGATAPTR